MADITEFLLEDGILREGTFKLAHGGESNWFFDAKKLMLHRGWSQFVLERFLHNMSRIDRECNQVVGVAYGAVPLVSQLVVYGFEQRKLCVCYCNFKGNSSEIMEGWLPPAGSRVFVMEDVITTGKSVRSVAWYMRRYHGVDITGIMAIADRNEHGAKQMLEQEFGCPVWSLFDFDWTEATPKVCAPLMN